MRRMTYDPETAPAAWQSFPRGLLFLFVLGWLAPPVGLFARGAEGQSKPNLILVLADDLGAAELGCYGNRQHRTPHLDRLAAEGLRLDTFYVTPLCTPTRVALMTGQYGFRNGFLGMQDPRFRYGFNEPQGQIGARFTIADLLGSAGYATAMAGKWQLSGRHPTLVRDCGFDEYRMWAYRDNLPEGVQHVGHWEGAPGNSNTSRSWHPCIVENGRYLPTKPEDYGPDLFLEFIVDFIRRHKEGPVFVYHTSVLTHSPWTETPDPDHPGRRWPGGFQSNLEYLDHLMGRLRRALEEMGVASNTVLLFLGDNGTGGRGKGTVTELGVRVPFIAWGPGRIKPRPGAERALSDLTDILPTLADLGGARLPQDVAFDGKSLGPLLRGETATHRDWIYSHLDDGRILRDARWLLEISKGGGPERFTDCGQSRDGQGYRDVTGSSDPEVRQARKRFEEILAQMPSPVPRADVAAPKKKAPKKRARPKGTAGA